MQWKAISSEAIMMFKICEFLVPPSPHHNFLIPPRHVPISYLTLPYLTLHYITAPSLQYSIVPSHVQVSNLLCVRRNIFLIKPDRVVLRVNMINYCPNVIAHPEYTQHRNISSRHVQSLIPPLFLPSHTASSSSLTGE